MKWDIKTIALIVAVIGCSVNIGIFSKCSDLQTVAMAKEQQKNIEDRITIEGKQNAVEHERMINELKEQRTQQQKTLDRILDLLIKKRKK